MKPLYTYISESLDSVYHYMSIKQLVSLINDDTFIAAEDDGYSLKRYPHYLSTTRQRNALTGYPTGLLDDKLVRLTLDYDKLRSKYKSGPVDWGKAKGQALKLHWDEETYELMKQDLMLQTNVENEERFYLNSDIISDFSRYIKVISTCERWLTPAYKKAIEDYCAEYNIELRLYDTPRQFLLGR
jgi:hypothetical protein